MVDLHMLAVSQRSGDFTLAYGACQALDHVGVFVLGIIQRVAGFELAQLTLQPLGHPNFDGHLDHAVHILGVLLQVAQVLRQELERPRAVPALDDLI